MKTTITLTLDEMTALEKAEDVLTMMFDKFGTEPDVIEGKNTGVLIKIEDLFFITATLHEINYDREFETI